ncbi:MAG: hypothetical protein LBO81_06550 [Clostridiales Family XIII bacterium]|nr:hypothetical protein [Clostridiales Family XIII bacterium]
MRGSVEHGRNRGEESGGMRLKDKRLCKQLTYGFSAIHSTQLISLIQYMNSPVIATELIGVKGDSAGFNIFKNQYQKIILTPPLKSFVDIMVFDDINPNLESAIQSFFEVSPEIINIFFSKQIPRMTQNNRTAIEEIADCLFEIMLDENVFLVSYNDAVYPQSGFEDDIRMYIS